MPTQNTLACATRALAENAEDLDASTRVSGITARNAPIILGKASGRMKHPEAVYKDSHEVVT